MPNGVGGSGGGRKQSSPVLNLSPGLGSSPTESRRPSPSYEEFREFLEQAASFDTASAPEPMAVAESAVVVETALVESVEQQLQEVLTRNPLNILSSICAAGGPTTEAEVEAKVWKKQGESSSQRKRRRTAESSRVVEPNNNALQQHQQEQPQVAADSPPPSRRSRLTSHNSQSAPSVLMPSSSSSTNLPTATDSSLGHHSRSATHLPPPVTRSKRKSSRTHRNSRPSGAEVGGPTYTLGSGENLLAELGAVRQPATLVVATSAQQQQEQQSAFQRHASFPPLYSTSLAGYQVPAVEPVLPNPVTAAGGSAHHLLPHHHSQLPLTHPLLHRSCFPDLCCLSSGRPCQLARFPATSDPAAASMGQVQAGPPSLVPPNAAPVLPILTNSRQANTGRNETVPAGNTYEAVLWHEWLYGASALQRHHQEVLQQQHQQQQQRQQQLQQQAMLAALGASGRLNLDQQQQQHQQQFQQQRQVRPPVDVESALLRELRLPSHSQAAEATANRQHSSRHRSSTNNGGGSAGRRSQQIQQQQQQGSSSSSSGRLSSSSLQRSAAVAFLHQQQQQQHSPHQVPYVSPSAYAHNLLFQMMSAGAVSSSEAVSLWHESDALTHFAEHMTNCQRQPKGLSKAELDELPTYRYSGSSSSGNRKGKRDEDEQMVCVVCMYDFEPKQTIRALRCSHVFHAKCIDKWLKTSRTCPICRADAGMEGAQSELTGAAAAGVVGVPTTLNEPPPAAVTLLPHYAVHL